MAESRRHHSNDDSNKMNPNLVRERQNASIEVEKLTNLLDGSKQKTERRRHIESLALVDNISQHDPLCFKSHDEIYDISVKKEVHIKLKLREYDLTDPIDRYYYRRILSHHENSPFGLQEVMFIPTLLSQASDEQNEKWLLKATNYQIIGAYAQTELGHGTFLRGLETTATYDPQSEEFVLNSPTLTSIKWWPGNLGKSANHTLVLAKLYTMGKCHGLHAFVLQIRRLDDHKPLEGVTLGEIGPKFGYNTNDNGYMKLNNVRIPRDHMLMRHCQVLKNGTYIKNNQPYAKSTYGTMVFVRSLLVGAASSALAESCTIAIRYSVVRHQSEIIPGTESRIIDYQTQQYKLLPLLATSYALHFSSVTIRETYFSLQEEISRGNADLAVELHALAACLKAYSTDVAVAGVEQCRIACGGHGYSCASGFPKIYTDICPSVTLEGENTVMYLQTARYLVKCYKQACSGKPLTGFVSYLNDNKTQTNLQSDKKFNTDNLLQAFRHCAQRLVAMVVKHLDELVKEGQIWELAWNASSIQLVKAAKAHCLYYVLHTFVKCLELTSNQPIKSVLTRLIHLYAVYTMNENLGDFVLDGYLSLEQVKQIPQALVDLLQDIRPDAVALVDAFDYHDRVLDSVLGRYDGQVYEHLLKWAENAPLNKYQVHPSFFKYTKPMMEKMSKL